MSTFYAIAESFLVWVVTVLVLCYLIFHEKVPAEDGNMAFYFMLQAAVPVAVFWWVTRQ